MSLPQVDALPRLIVRAQAGVLILAVALLAGPVAVPDPFGVGDSLAWAMFALVAALLVCVPEMILGRWPRSRLDWLLGGYVFILVAAGLAGVDRAASLGAVSMETSVIGLFYAATIVARRSRAAGPALLTLVVAATIVELAAFSYHVAVGLSQRPKEYPIPSGWSGYPELGALAGIQLGVLAGALLGAKGTLPRVSLGLLAAAAGLGILFLYSRATWVTALAIGAFVMWFSRVPRRWLLAAGAGAVLLLLTLALTVPTLRTLTGSLFGVAPSEDPAFYTAAPGARIDIWTRTLAMIRDSPLHGVGPGNFRPVFEQQYNPEANLDQRRGVHAHNLWLQRAGELGVPGGSYYLLLWGVLLWTIWRYARRTRHPQAVGVLLALLGLTVSNAIDNVPSLVAGFRVHLLTWVLFGLGVGLAAGDQRPTLRDEPA